MTYRAANITPADPIYVSTLTKNSVGLAMKSFVEVAAASATYSAVDRIHYTPFYLSRSYSLARWWWLNGATVGTNYLQVGIYDENLNLLKASPRTLSAGTANLVQYANPGIHGTNVIQSNSGIDASTFTTTSVTLKAGVLYLMAVENTHGTSAHAISSIDNGPTFTSRSTTQFNSSLGRVSIWSAVPTVDYTGTLVINFGANTETSAYWSLNAFYHVDTATNNGVVQNAVGTGSSVTPLATLAAFGSANNATFGAFGIGVSNAGTPSTGYLELSDNTANSSPVSAMQTVFRPDNDTTVDETITSAAWGACAVEIKSLGTSAVYVPPMRGYLAIHGNGVTATLFRITGVARLSPFTYIQSSATSGLPPTATLAPATGSLGHQYVFGFTSRSSP